MKKGTLSYRYKICQKICQIYVQSILNLCCSNGSAQEEEEEVVPAVVTVEQSKAVEEVELEAAMDSLDIDEGSQAFDKTEPSPVVKPQPGQFKLMGVNGRLAFM